MPMIPNPGRKPRKNTQNVESARQEAVPNLSDSEPGMQTLSNADPNDEQWNSAYKQLFDRN